jgi:hypothetical protein
MDIAISLLGLACPTSGESLSLTLLLLVPADERLRHGLISGCCQATELLFWLLCCVPSAQTSDFVTL